MKKRLLHVLAGILAVALLLAACQSTPSVSDPAPSAPAETNALPPVTKTPAPAPFAPDDKDMPASLDKATEELVNGMHPVFDSTIRALIDMPADMRYIDGNDPMIFWSVMYYFCVNYGTIHPAVKETEDIRNSVPGDVLREFADACFAEYTNIPKIPPQTFDISYDKESDTYYFGLSDPGDTFVEKLHYEINSAGEIEALMAFMAYGEDMNEMLNVFRFTLAPYSASASENEPLFPFRVFSAHESYTDIAMVTNISEKNGVYYATLDFVDIVYHDAEELDADGQPYGTDFREFVNNKVEAVDVRISENASFQLVNMDSAFEDANMDDAVNNAFAFFVKNAAKKTVDGQHVYFNLNIYQGVLFGGELSDYYCAG